VPTHVPLGDYMEHGVPVLDQGSEGACTGFGLATVANYLLLRRRVVPDNVPVSPRMFYELARRYDEWPGEDYSGSSARGAMKGWHKHGVCSETLFPYKPAKKNDPRGLTDARTSDALRRPLGAYFRVNHKDIVAMHTALAEVGVLYVTCTVHTGWNDVGADGAIAQSASITGGHAFAIVAFDEQGFWLQNSWGPSWGRQGFARISYDDWLENGTDAWVARLGAPVTLRKLESIASVHAATAAQSNAYAFADLRPHIVSVGNNGALKAGGDYGSTPAELARIFDEDIPRVTRDWDKPRILLYAHGGLVSEQAATQRLAEYRPPLLGGNVYPLAFIWRTDYWTTVTNILKDTVSRRRPEGVLDATKDFMLDRLDDALEPLARVLTGKSAWDEMKQNALAASRPGGAAVLVADHLKALKKKAARPGNPHGRPQRGFDIARAGGQAAERPRAEGGDLHAVGAGLHGGPVPLGLPARDAEGHARQDGRLCARRQDRARRQLRQDLQQVAAVPGVRGLRGAAAHTAVPRGRAHPGHGALDRRRPARHLRAAGRGTGAGAEQRARRFAGRIDRDAPRRLRRRREDGDVDLQAHRRGGRRAEPGCARCACVAWRGRCRFNAIHARARGCPARRRHADVPPLRVVAARPACADRLEDDALGWGAGQKGLAKSRGLGGCSPPPQPSPGRGGSKASNASARWSCSSARSTPAGWR
jgi:hypothetical protein